MEGGAAVGVAPLAQSDAVKAAGVKASEATEGSGRGTKVAKPERDASEATAARLPEHCDEPGAGDGSLSHTGKDYFCCNRAVGEAELAAVAKGSMRDYIASGGRFPVMVVTHDRASTLDRTLDSLLRVRCVTPSDVHVVQDGAVAAVSDVIKKRGVRHHMKAEGEGGGQSFRGGNGRPMDGAGRIAQHFRYALSYMFATGAPDAPAVIVAEDDFLFSPDWFEYFHAVAPALEADPSLWIASAWVSGMADAGSSSPPATAALHVSCGSFTVLVAPTVALTASLMLTLSACCVLSSLPLALALALALAAERQRV